MAGGGMSPSSLRGSPSYPSFYAENNFLSWMSTYLLGESGDEETVAAQTLPMVEVEAPPPPPPQPPAEARQPVVNPGKKRKRSSASGAGRKKPASGSRRETAASGAGGSDDVVNDAQRRQLAKQQAAGWWLKVSSPLCPEGDFKREFHVSRRTFHYLCDELGASVGKEDTWLHAVVPVPKRVAACLWRLAHGHSCLKVSERFGIGVSTVHKLRIEFCDAVKSVLLDGSLAWPENQQAADAIAAKFEGAAGIRGVWGAVYTTHVPIIAPDRKVLDYYNIRHAERNNNKASYSVSIQGTVDADGAFTDLCIGSPGSVSDEDVLLNYSDLNNGARRQQPFRVLGGASYPLTDYMLVPYDASSSTDNCLTPAQEELNRAVAAGTAVAKGAFMRLKARWGFLRKRSEVKLPELRNVIQTCCALHNICVRLGDDLDPELAFDLFDDDMRPEVPVRSAAAAQERDAIAVNLLLRKLAEGI